MLLKVYGGIELSNDFIVPILLECQYISQVLGRASCNDSIEDGIILVLHVSPIQSPWLVYCDGAWGTAGAGTATILISPSGIKLCHAARL
jgi:hypothetical protein